MGGTDMDEEGTFIWNSGRPAAGYLNWDTGASQPDNAPVDSDCFLARIINDWMWYDGDCTANVGGIVCQVFQD